MEFLEHHALYVVGIISAVIWLGIFFFMFSLERRVRKAERAE
jgi:CcmD family protein